MSPSSQDEQTPRVPSSSSAENSFAQRLPALASREGPTRAEIRMLRKRRKRTIVVATAFAFGCAVLLGKQLHEMHQTSLARSATHAYAEAVVAFERDHGGRPPLMNTPDWPDKLAGPVDDSGRPYMRSLPAYIRSHPFDVIQTVSRSGQFASPEAVQKVKATSTHAAFVIQYVPYGQTFSVKQGRYVYEGYLVLINSPYEYQPAWWIDDFSRSCEAWGNPVRVLCGGELWDIPRQ